jgi:hypothetical protein
MLGSNIYIYESATNHVTVFLGYIVLQLLNNNNNNFARDK